MKLCQIVDLDTQKRVWLAFPVLLEIFTSISPKSGGVSGVVGVFTYDTDGTNDTGARGGSRRC